MLLELAIRDFAIVDQLRISWNTGFNALTGETGAGKSIIVDAVGALLGDRLGPEAVRSGQDRAMVEGIFALEVGSPAHASLRELLAPYELMDEDGQLIMSREIGRAGRGVGRLNGRPVPMSLLQQVGEHLVDIHGQSQHLSLLRVREHLDLLDRFAGLLELRFTVAELVDRWRGLQDERRTLHEEIRAAARERDLLRHEVAEIEAANLQPGEDEELASLRQRLHYAEKVRHSVEQALLALQGADEQRGAIDLLSHAARLCGEASRTDSGLAARAEALEHLATEIEEARIELRRYLDDLDTDPRQVEEIEARFLALADLKRKYGENVVAVLAYLEQARERLARAERGEEMIAELEQQERAVRAELARAALDLSTQRKQAVERLAEAVEQELQDLNLESARFSVAIEQREDPDGIDWPNMDIRSSHGVRDAQATPARVAVDRSGADRVEFIFSANPGEPPRPLARIASGGELARVALALKAVLARVDQRATLIFDEIDVGVGGRGANVVGQKLWELTETHQVLCVTHMPQVAVYADQHFVVAKNVDGESTTTSVEPVVGLARVGELAAMLGGSGSRAAEANARELLTRSESWKSTHSNASKAG